MVNNYGFSLMELLIASGIVSILLVALAVMFSTGNRVFTRENVTTALQSDVRAALEIMSRDIRMVGYDPEKTGDFELENASSTRLHFTVDLDGDGVVDPSPSFPDCEVLSYRYSAAGTGAIQVICGEGTGSQDPATLIGGEDDLHVTGLDFDYKDSSGNSTSFKNDMRGVVITITAEAPAGAVGMITRTYETWVDFRNAGPNSSI